MPQPIARALALGLILLAGQARGAGGVYNTTKHGDPVTGVLRVPTEPPGECAHCHVQHASRGGLSTAGPFPFLLFAANDNALCYSCHQTGSLEGSYQGNILYNLADHALSPSMTWPGPTPPLRPSSDWGKCVNCHNPHGNRDASGPVPNLLTRREEGLCLTCHDGTPAAKDINAQLQKAFRHPTGTVTGRHSAGEGGNPAVYGATPNNRHAECVDCHNPHAARVALPPALAPNAPGALYNVSRVRVTNGAAGTVPIYAYLPSSDLSFPNEYEVCFKCHSSWTTLPLGATDLAVIFNPNNPSFHPVEGTGKNPLISPTSFVNGWSTASNVYCSHCHGSDDTAVAGPHGSVYPSLLKKPYPLGSTRRITSSNELCFECHSYDTYANKEASVIAQASSRFNRPQAEQGHVFHVGEKEFPCYACHTTHGSTTLPFLLVTGRSPGISSYVQTVNGGTCTPTCHGSENYSVNYPR